MKRYLAEGLGTGLIVLAVIGSAFLVKNLTNDSAIQLLINCLSTVVALYISIQLCAEISGAHFNPIVSVISFVRKSISSIDLMFYVISQFVGALIGSMLANVMFSSPVISMSTISRASNSTLVGEVISSFGLILIVFSQWRKFSNDQRALLISLWIASAYFFTSSTSFANPAVSFGRVFTNSPAGIELNSFTKFAMAQIVGGALGYIFSKSRRSYDHQ